MSLVARYPRAAKVLKEFAFYALVIAGVFVFYAWVLPLVGVET